MPITAQTMMAYTTAAILFRFIKIPVTWDLVSQKRVRPELAQWQGQVIRGRFDRTPTSEMKVGELDGHEHRREFLALQENDIEGLRDFLNTVGAWDTWEDLYDPSPLRFWSKGPVYVYPPSIWEMQRAMRKALLDKKRLTGRVAPPKTLQDVLAELDPQHTFPLHFDFSEVVAGTVTVLNARQMLWTTVFADVAKGLNFKECKRRDCDRIFPVGSKHKRKFCTQYCGHLVSVRKSQAAARKRKRAEKRALGLVERPAR
jgi:hypothetical protein